VVDTAKTIERLEAKAVKLAARAST
jgi:hypothetical protein